MYFLFFILANVCLLSTSSAQKKNDPCKGKAVSSDLGILYPALEIYKTQNLIIKLRWRKILPQTPRNYFLLVPTRIFLGIGNSQRPLLGDYSLLFPVGVYPLTFCWEPHISLCGFYYTSPFLGNYMYFRHPFPLLH